MDSIKLTLEIPADLATALTVFLQSVKVVAIEKTSKETDTTNKEKKEEAGCVDVGCTGKEAKVEVEIVGIPTDEEEVVDYCRKNGIEVDSRKFYKYYSKRNWHNSKGVPIDDWKQLLRKWEEEDKRKEKRDPLQGSYDMMRGWANK